MRLSGSSFFETIELSDKGEVPNRVQILRTGKFKHPKYGNFEITRKVLAEMKANFDARVRGQDIAFDYFHNSDQEASAWAKELSLSEDGEQLWATVDWTPKAQKKLSERELRYFSPDFTFKWTDPESGKTFNNVLFGGGLTNRPFVKEMKAIVANEPEGNKMDIETLTAQVKDLEAKNLKLAEEKETAIGKIVDIAPLTKEIEALKAKNAELEGKISEVETAKKLAEQETKFNLLLTEGKACAAQKDAFLKGDMENFIKLAEPLNTKAAGSSKNQDSETMEDKIYKLAEEKQKADKTLDFSAAVKLAKQELK